VFLEWGDFALFGVVSLSVVRKFSAPSSGKSTAAARQAPCVQTSRLRSLSLFVLSFAGLPVKKKVCDTQ